jgi:hypothetical protein
MAAPPHQRRHEANPPYDAVPAPQRKPPDTARTGTRPSHTEPLCRAPPLGNPPPPGARPSQPAAPQPAPQRTAGPNPAANRPASGTAPSPAPPPLPSHPHAPHRAAPRHAPGYPTPAAGPAAEHQTTHHQVCPTAVSPFVPPRLLMPARQPQRRTRRRPRSLSTHHRKTRLTQSRGHPPQRLRAPPRPRPPPRIRRRRRRHRTSQEHRRIPLLTRRHIRKQPHGQKTLYDLRSPGHKHCAGGVGHSHEARISRVLRTRNGIGRGGHAALARLLCPAAWSTSARNSSAVRSSGWYPSLMHTAL